MIYESINKKIEDLEPYNLTLNNNQDNKNLNQVKEQNENQNNKMFRTVPKLHYDFDNNVENLKMYMRVGISLQIFTFVLIFIIYLILIRNYLK